MEVVQIVSTASLSNGWRISYEYSGGTGQIFFTQAPWKRHDDFVEIDTPQGQKVLLPCPDDIKRSAFGFTKRVTGRGMTPWGV